MKLIMSFLAASCALGYGQGSLTPPGTPAPVMKSLQEIWDKLGDVATQSANLQEQTTEAQQLFAPVYEKLNISLPWMIQTVDSAGDVGSYASLAVGPSGRPAIAYYDATRRNLNFASYDGSAWTVEIARAAPSSNYNYGKYASLAYGPGGEPAISFFADATPRDLAFSKRSGTGWTFETVDGYGAVTIFGHYTSLAYGPSGQPAISYQNVTNQDLKFASYNGSMWSLQVVAGSGNVGEYTSLAYLQGGTPAISYYNVSSGDLMYARFDGAAWQLTTVDSTGDVGKYSSLAIGPDGLPAIAYYDVTNTALKYAKYDGAAWVTTTAADGTPPTDIGKHASLAFAPSGNPAVSCYSDGTPKDLIYAYYDGSTWRWETVDGVGTSSQLGLYSSLVFGPAGQAMIAYYDGTNADLKFAVKAPYTNP